MPLQKAGRGLDGLFATGSGRSGRFSRRRVSRAEEEFGIPTVHSRRTRRADCAGGWHGIPSDNKTKVDRSECECAQHRKSWLSIQFASPWLRGERLTGNPTLPDDRCRRQPGSGGLAATSRRSAQVHSCSRVNGKQGAFGEQRRMEQTLIRPTGMRQPPSATCSPPLRSAYQPE